MSFKPDICYSHSNGNLLSDHLFYVGKAVYEILPYNKEVGFLTGIFHDFGKLTSFYQKYIQSKINNEFCLDVNEKQKSHTAFGAFFSLYFFNTYFNEEQKKYLPAILNCAFHHSPLSNIESLVIKNKKLEDKSLLRDQAEDLQQRISVIEKVYKNELCALISVDSALVDLQNIISAIDFTAFLDIALNNLNEILKPIRYFFMRNIKKDGNPETAFFTTALYGSLVSADRELADKLPEAFLQTYQKPNDYHIDPNIIKQYVSDKFGNRDKFKSLIFKTVANALEDSKAMSFNIFNITAPTGSGKTETSLNFAFRLKDLLNGERIIYALPLTNVLEQNYNRLHNIFTKYLPGYHDGNCLNYLLKYHYLANYDDLINEDNSLGEALKNAEQLNSKVVITTYIQVLYGLFSNSPHFLSRFPLFNNAIIIFDEPQVLSPSHWLLIKNGFKLLTEKFNCKIVLLTATKPLIFNDSECYELTRSIDFKSYLKNRTCLKPALHINIFDDLISLLKEQSSSHLSMLVVLNTIKSSIEFFNKLKNDSFFNEYSIYYLSTNLIPVHRKEVIEKVSNLLEKKKKLILVATQVIEAGVEFDFDMGVRDMATFDSLVQTAGRVNRTGKKATSTLFIAKLQDEKTKLTFSSFIYDETFLDFTEKLLLERSTIKEEEYCLLTEKYFKAVSDYMSDFNDDDEKDNAFSFYKKLQFEELVSKFKIIEDDISKIPVLIPYDECIEKYINEYLDILDKFKAAKYEDKWNLKRLLTYSKRKIIPYLVNISSNGKSINELKGFLIQNENPITKWASVVDKNFIEYCYDYNSNTKIGQGIKLNSESESLWL